MMLLFQLLFLLILALLISSLNMAGQTEILAFGQDAIRTVWGVVVTLLWVAIWVGSGIAAGVVTRLKRHGFALGCIGSVFLGPLALLIALVIPRRR